MGQFWQALKLPISLTRGVSVIGMVNDAVSATAPILLRQHGLPRLAMSSCRNSGIPDRAELVPRKVANAASGGTTPIYCPLAISVTSFSLEIVVARMNGRYQRQKVSTSLR